MTDRRNLCSGFVDVQGTRLHYLQRGDPAGLPVVFVHGMRDHARSWDWIAESLTDRFMTIALDLRGHGDSSRGGVGGYGIANFVRDLAGVIEALLSKPAVIIGHSLGAAIAARYAAAFPERTKALCAIEGIELPIVRDQHRHPTAHPLRLRGWIEAERGLTERQPRRYASLTEVEARLSEGLPTLDPATIGHLARHGVMQSADGCWLWKYDNAARLRAPDDAHGVDLDETLAGVACPSLLVYGESSWIPVPERARLDLIRNHRLVTSPQAGHWLHHQRRDGFVAALHAFLADITERPHHA